MKYFIIENNQQAGPYTIYELKDKGLKSDTLVWTEGMDDWKPAWQVDELKNFLYTTASAPTPPPVPPTNAEQPQAQPEQEEQPQKKKGHCGLIALGILVLLLLVMVFANPSKEDHIDAMQSSISKAIEKQTSGDDFFSQGLGMLSKMFADQITGPVLNNVLTYHNYVVFSTTTVRWNGKDHRASLGLLGQVFTVDEDDIIKAVEKGDNVPSNDNADTDDDAQDGTYVQAQPSQTDSAGNATTQIIDGVGNAVKSKIKEQTDSSTASGIDKIIDGIAGLLKGE